MKQILIIALCFISLINAADDQKEIERTITDIPYRGYTLSEKECKPFSFVGVGIRQIGNSDNCLAIAAQIRTVWDDDFSPYLIEYRINNDQNEPSEYLKYKRCFGGTCRCRKFTQSDPADHKLTSKALTLLQLYTITDAKRTALEAKPVSESEKSQPE